MIPTFGFPSRTAAILALRKQGKSDYEIAALLDLDLKLVRNHAAASAKYRTASYPGGRLTIPRELALPLTASAEKRGMLLQQLVSHLITTIAREDLVDAVLDDGPETGPANG